jgi:hypothetical protein
MQSALAKAGWEIVDGRREPIALVDYEDFLDGHGNVRQDMLPDEWHIYQRLWKDPRAQRRELELCRRDPWRWLVTWCWTFDSQDPIQPVKRFPEWSYLHSLEQHWIAGYDFLPEKPRQMLTTILFSYLLGHGVQFEEHFPAFAMSFLKTRVDDGGDHSTYASIHGMIRFMWQLEPSWMRAPLHFRQWRISNRHNPRNYLVAEAAGIRTGRGLQARRAFLDEIAYAGPASEAMVAAADRACPTGKVYNGTPKGRANAQFRIRDDIEHGRNTKVRLVKLRWWHHPNRRRCISCGSTKMTQRGTSYHLRGPERAAIQLGLLNAERAEMQLEQLEAPPAECPQTDGLHYDVENNRWSGPWYVNARMSMTDSLAAQELDVSYEESVEGRVYPIFRRRVFLAKAGPDDVRYRRDWHQVWSWDFGIDDFTDVGCGQHKGYGQGARAEVYDHFGDNQKSYEYFCLLYGWLTGQFHKEIHFDAETMLPYVVPEETWLPRLEHRKFEKRWGRPGRFAGSRILHVGDPSGQQRESDLLSYFQRYALGARVQDRKGEVHMVGQIYMNAAPAPGLWEGIQTVTWALEHGRIRLASHLDDLASAYENYHRETDEGGQVKVNRPPEHDWTSHPMDQQRYFCLQVFGLQGGFVAR